MEIENVDQNSLNFMKIYKYITKYVAPPRSFHVKATTLELVCL